MSDRRRSESLQQV